MSLGRGRACGEEDGPAEQSLEVGMGVPLQELGQGLALRREEGKGSSWEDVRKAGDSYTPAYTLNLTSTIQMRKNTVD